MTGNNDEFARHSVDPDFDNMTEFVKPQPYHRATVLKRLYSI